MLLVTCTDCISKAVSTYCMNIQNLWHTVLFCSLHPHIKSNEIILSQLELWSTIHCSSWWGSSKMEVYRASLRETPLCIISLSLLCHINARMRTRFPHSRCNPLAIIQQSAHNCAGIFPQVSSQWAAIDRQGCSLSCLGGGRPPISRCYPFPSNINRLLGDSWWQAILIG